MLLCVFPLSASGRRRRQIRSAGSICSVQQVKGRHPKDAAFKLEVGYLTTILPILVVVVVVVVVVVIVVVIVVIIIVIIVVIIIVIIVIIVIVMGT